MLLQADARTIPLAEATVQCVVTSPPYWGLRDYGLEPQVWPGPLAYDGEQLVCRHEWTTDSRIGSSDEKVRWQHGVNGEGRINPAARVISDVARKYPLKTAFCATCGAWRGNLGLEPTPELYVQHIVEIFREVHRVLRPDGTLWLNLGDAYFGSGKGFNIAPCKQETNRGSLRGLPSAARHLGKAKDLVGIPWRVAFALQADGWWLRSDIIWSKPNPMPESVTDRPTKAHEYLFLLTKRERYFFDQDAVREPLSDGPLGGRQLAERRGEASNHNKDYHDGRANRLSAGRFVDTRNVRTVWEIATQPYAGAHFATFPEALAERCIKAGSRPGDLVLDPFAGSGTVGRVAERLNRRWICMDLKYQELAAERTCVQKELLEVSQTEIYDQ